MKCKVCGAESGKYPLCRDCNAKNEQGLIIKCDKCGTWHYVDSACPESVARESQTAENTPISAPTVSPVQSVNEKYLYDSRPHLLSIPERGFFDSIKASVPNGYNVFPQICLSAFIDRTDDSRFRNELFRIVDFLVTDSEYKPCIAIEINDRTHLDSDRRERDQKVNSILEEAGIPLITLWSSYGVNGEYIRQQISSALAAPVSRKHNFVIGAPQTQNNASLNTSKPPKKQGCYIATCVYGSYDCPPVWVLRRYRDTILRRTLIGRLFIHTYYALSPLAVRLFGGLFIFRAMFRHYLDRKVNHLIASGYSDKPYSDN